MRFILRDCECGVLFPDQIFDWCPIDIGHGFIHQDKPAVGILGINIMGDQVDDLPQALFSKIKSHSRSASLFTMAPNSRVSVPISSLLSVSKPLAVAADSPMRVRDPSDRKWV